eukprot:SAG25_NODE_67_length_17436_cov_89.239257_5_plen_89_part_00
MRVVKSMSSTLTSRRQAANAHLRRMLGFTLLVAVVFFGSGRVMTHYYDYYEPPRSHTTRAVLALISNPRQIRNIFVNRRSTFRYSVSI